MNYQRASDFDSWRNRRDSHDVFVASYLLRVNSPYPHGVLDEFHIVEIGARVRRCAPRNSKQKINLKRFRLNDLVPHQAITVQPLLTFHELGAQHAKWTVTDKMIQVRRMAERRSFLKRSIRRARREETIDMRYASFRTVFLAVCVASLAHGEESKWQEGAPTTSRKAVIVELFTSEGCSTCPPAEALLARLAASQRPKDSYVIPLEEHVDYWNHDGWIDPYSSVEWTGRQREYVERFKEDGPYTPQMIVDGERQFVGSQEREAEEAIREAENRAKTDVVVTAEEPNSDGTQQFKVLVRKIVGNTNRDVAEVLLAVTETGLESTIRGGENAGRELHHAALLRALHKIGVVTLSGDPYFDFAASPRVKFKSAWTRQNLQVVVFVQEKKSRRILGAASLGVAR